MQTKKVLIIYTCDRCDTRQEIENEPHLWATLNGQYMNGAVLVPNYKVELCPVCAEQFKNWYNGEPP